MHMIILLWIYLILSIISILLGYWSALSTYRNPQSNKKFKWYHELLAGFIVLFLPLILVAGILFIPYLLFRHTFIERVWE